MKEPVLIHSLEQLIWSRRKETSDARVDPVTRMAQHVGQTQHTAASSLNWRRTISEPLN